MPGIPDAILVKGGSDTVRSEVSRSDNRPIGINWALGFSASQHCLHEILMLLMLLAPYTHLMTKTGMGSAAGYQGLTARSQRSDKFGAAVRTLLVRRPVFPLACLATVDDFFATATALEFSCAYLARVASGARTFLEHMRFDFGIVVGPVPYMRRHPEILS